MDSKKLSDLILPWLWNSTLTSSDEKVDLSPSELLELAQKVKSNTSVQSEDLQNFANVETAIGDIVHKAVLHTSLAAQEKNYTFKISQLFRYSLSENNRSFPKKMNEFVFPTSMEQAVEIGNQYRFQLSLVVAELEKSAKPKTVEDANQLLKKMELYLTLLDSYQNLEALGTTFPNIEKGFNLNYSYLSQAREYELFEEMSRILASSPITPQKIKSALTDQLNILKARAGANLAPEKSIEFYRLDAQLKKRPSSTYPILEFTTEELAGLPKKNLDDMLERSVLKDPNKKRIRIQPTLGDIYSILDNCDVEETRKKVWYTMRNMDKLQDAESNENLKKIEEVRVTLSEITSLLGLNFKNSLDRFLNGGIIPNADSAKSFIDQLAGFISSSPTSPKVRDLKRTLTKNPLAEFMPWDVWYLPNKLKAQNSSFSFDQKFTALSADKLKDGVLKWVASKEDGFNLEFKSVAQISSALTQYEVYDKDETPPRKLGTVYLDTGIDKKKTASVKSLRKSHLLDGTEQVIYINLDLRGAGSNDHVKRAFHEMGHLIRRLMGKYSVQDSWCDGDELFTAAFERASLNKNILKKYFGISLTEKEGDNLRESGILSSQLDLFNNFIKAKNLFDLYGATSTSAEIERENYSKIFPFFVKKYRSDLKGYGIAGDERFYWSDYNSKMEHRYFLSIVVGLVLNQKLFDDANPDKNKYGLLKESFKLSSEGFTPLRQLSKVLGYDESLLDKQILEKIIAESGKVLTRN